MQIDFAIRTNYECKLVEHPYPRAQLAPLVDCSEARRRLGFPPRSDPQLPIESDRIRFDIFTRSLLLYYESTGWLDPI
uniref:N-acetyltransferase n=1 Tax=Steinernema glaseri TaxID=37863 RepID=A0A1I8A0F4_9BILA